MSLGPYPLAKARQALLEGWTVASDTAGVLNTVTDGAGYSDVLTHAVAGSIYFSKPIADFSGFAVGSGLLQITALARLITGSTSADQCGVGTSDNSNPIAGGALRSFAANRQDGSTQAGTSVSSGIATTGSDRALVSWAYFEGRDEFAWYAFGYTGTTYDGVRGQGGIGANTPTHLYVRVANSAAIVQTIRIAAGFLIYPTFADLTVAARS